MVAPARHHARSGWSGTRRICARTTASGVHAMQRCQNEKTNPISSGTGAILRVRVRATPNHQNEPNYLRVTRPGSRFHSPRTAKTNPIRSLHPSSIASVSPKSRKRTQFLLHAFKNEPNSRQPETPAPERSEDPDVIVPTTAPRARNHHRALPFAPPPAQDVPILLRTDFVQRPIRQRLAAPCQWKRG